MRLASSLLEVRNIEVGYGKIRVLWGVSLDIGVHEKVALIGPNGAGKSTLIKAIMGILKPSAGNIYFSKQDITGADTYRIARLGIGYVPEGSMVIPRLTVFENLLAAVTTKDAEKRKEDTLELVYTLFPILKERKDQLGGTLSGGEQRMLAIARALMLRPKLLIIDELSLGLAPKVIGTIYSALDQLYESQKISILITEQFVEKALRFSQRAYLLEKGRIALQGISEELANNEYIRKAYIG
jgi:amino acid/amide ABC transporter ATP-binding protein 2, HAAT family (TC 3.A.1.4.-)